MSAVERPLSSSTSSARPADAGMAGAVAESDADARADAGTEAEATVDRSISAEYTSSRRFRTFDSLIEVPAFRWYLLSMMGNWSAMQMQQVVRGSLAYEITGSFTALGGVAIANALPRLFLALVGGVLADRASRRLVLQAGQLASAVFTAAIAVLLFTDQLRIEHLYVAAALQGAAMSFSMPARQAMIPDIVGEERLTNAIGLNASGMNTMRLLAPATAGILVAYFDYAWGYALMTALFTLAVIGMFRVPKQPTARAASTSSPILRAGHGHRSRGGLKEMNEGFKYLGRNPTLRMLLAVHLFVVILTLTFQRLAPGFVAEVLASDEQQARWRLGVVLTFMGAGALIGSLAIASLPNRKRGRLLIGSIALFGVALLAFAVSQSFWISLGIVFILGIGQAGRQSLSQILIQSHTENAYRGRISSIMMMEMGFESLGTFVIALVAGAFGAQVAFGSVAVALLLLALVVTLFLPAYRRLD
ncbi:MAG: MFS transporter [Dehalococcoidia bacterium]